jgi:hypothetical protein
VVNESVLQYGNWLLVQSDSLPPWVGVIDTPREWSPRIVSVHAYTPEHVFGQRRGPLELKITGSAGTIFDKLLTRVNNEEKTVIVSGDIWRGGTQREETINPTPLSEDLERIYERSREEYTWRPETDDNGKLVVYADWVQRLGVDTTALLHEGKGGGNIENLNNVFVEDGDIFNDILSYGDGLSWQSKPNVTVIDPPSGEKYGLRQTSLSNSGVTTTNTLRANGLDHLAQVKDTVKTFHVNALNVGDTYKFLQLGNSMVLRFENIGFGGYETNVRIVGMIMDSANKNKVELVLEETV